MTEVVVQKMAGFPDVGYVDGTGNLADELASDPQIREVARALQVWVNEGRAQRRGSLFDRQGYVSTDNPYTQMRIARKAVQQDDVVGGTADVTEGLIFQRASFESAVPDDADCFNQLAADLNLDAVLRSAYRELFTYSQVVIAETWGTKEYRVREMSSPDIDKAVEEITKAKTPKQFDLEGNPIKPPPPEEKPQRRKRRKTYKVSVPTELSILDPTMIVPVGSRIFGPERLAWIGSPAEGEVWDQMMAGKVYDSTLAQLVVGRYVPPKDSHEERQLLEWGIDITNLLELNPQRVWRHTLTKPNFQKFPDIRMVGVFRLLDLKQQLMDADRAQLVGAANYILLVKKGDKDKPGTPNEIDNLKQGFQVLARVPVIVSDHRLSIEIITPDNEFTLATEKYDTIDRRIFSRLIGALSSSSSGQRNESTLTVAKMVARLLENRRHMLKRAVELHVVDRVIERNPEAFESFPKVTWTPSRVELDTQSEILSAVLALRSSNEISRRSALEYVGLDEGVELQRRIEEALSGADQVFQTAVPFNSPANNPGAPAVSANPRNQGAQGAKGGRPKGGGEPKKNAAQPNKPKE